jgi:hypothetical protein
MHSASGSAKTKSYGFSGSSSGSAKLFEFFFCILCYFHVFFNFHCEIFLAAMQTEMKEIPNFSCHF